MGSAQYSFGAKSLQCHGCAGMEGICGGEHLPAQTARPLALRQSVEADGMQLLCTRSAVEGFQLFFPHGQQQMHQKKATDCSKLLISKNEFY